MPTYQYNFGGSQFGKVARSLKVLRKGLQIVQHKTTESSDPCSKINLCHSRSSYAFIAVTYSCKIQLTSKRSTITSQDIMIFDRTKRLRPKDVHMTMPFGGGDFGINQAVLRRGLQGVKPPRIPSATISQSTSF